MEQEKPYDEDFPAVELGDVLRLKEPCKTWVNRSEHLYRSGIVVEALQATPRRKVRNVSLHIDTAAGKIHLGPNFIPELCG